MQLGLCLSRFFIIMVDLMPETLANSENAHLLVVEPQSKNPLGEILLVGDPIPVSDWLGSNGPLQRFEIISGRHTLRKVWADQDEVLLLTKFGQRNIRITTFPTEGEMQGHLDYTSELVPYRNLRTSPNPFIKRGLAFIQSLLGA